MEVRDRVGARRRRAAIALVGAGLALVAFAAPAAEAKGGAKAKITRSAHGIPTIESDTYKGLGFGYGYAFAQDNICTIAEAYVTVERRALALLRRRRQRLARQRLRRNNLNSDFFFQRIIDDRGRSRSCSTRGAAERRRSPRSARASRGYVAGYNGYLDEDRRRQPARSDLPRRSRGCGRSPRSTSTAASTSSACCASGDVAIDGIVDAQPPPPAGADGRRADRRAERRRASSATALAAGGDSAPTRWALGSEATENGSGMVLGNPHFPWQGSERFYQSHLTIPGKLNVSGGEPVRRPGDPDRPHREPRLEPHGLDRVPVHAVRAQLVPGDPTSYLVDGQPDEDGADDGHRADPAAGRLARAGDPDALLDPLRAGLQRRCQGQPLFAWTPSDRVRDVRRQRRQLPLRSTTSSRSTARSRPRSCSTILSASTRASRGSTRSPPTRRARRSTPTSARSRTSPTRRRRRCNTALGAVTFPAARAAGARRLALRVRAGHRRRRGRPGHLRRLDTSRTCSAATTSRTRTTATGSRTPSSRSRASRGSSATSAPRARCARGSG